MRHRLLWCVVVPVLCALLLAYGAPSARAAGFVTDCSNDTQLRTLLASGGNVSFNCGGTNSPATIVVNPALLVNSGQTTLDGGGKVTLSGANTNRVFHVDAGVFGSPLGFTLTHITLTNGYAGAEIGGCMIIGFSASVVLDDVTVHHCRTEPAGQGGGIDNFLGNLTVRNSRIVDNEAGVGGGIRSNSPITLTNTLLASNHAITGAGLAVGLYPAFISGSTFYSNSATGGGGGLYVGQYVQVTLVDSQINGNRASDGNGGGIYIYPAGALTLSNSTLNANTATQSGGGIYNNTGTATLNNSTLSGNSAFSGGGIFNGGTTTLNNTTLSGNSASLGDGGGIYNLSIATLNNSAIRDNSAASGGGGGIYNLSIATLNNSAIRDNSAASGGGIYNDVGTATLNNSTLSGNSATNNGGGIRISFGAATLNNSTLSGNSAGIGGGIANRDGAATLNNSTLNGNSATNKGGGIHNDRIATLNNSTLSGNSAVDGGGMYNAGGSHLRNVTLSNNAAAQGGALYMFGGHITVLTNTILAYSPSGGNCFGTLGDTKFTFSSDNSCGLPPGETIKGMNPNGLDPLLTALGNYGGPTLVHMPKATSPAVAGIVGNDAPLFDQRGMARPGPDGSYDIGAVERYPSDTDRAPRLFLPLLRR